MGEDVAFQTIINNYDWDLLLNRTRHSDLMQTWEYGEAIKKTVGFEPIRQLILRKGQPLAMAQVLLKEVSGIGPVARIQNGPLFFDIDEIWQPMSAIIAIRELKNFWVGRQQRHFYLTPCLLPNEMPKKWYKELDLRVVSDPVWCSVKIDISQSEEEIHQQMKRQWRKSLDKAARENFQVKMTHADEDLQFFLLQYRLEAKDNTSLWPSSDLLEEFWQLSDTNSQLFLAYKNESYVSGLMTTVFGNTVFALASWETNHPSDNTAIRYLVWRAIQHYKELRYKWFDLGGADPSRKMGATAFKRTSGGVEYAYVGNYEAFPTFLSREASPSRKHKAMYGFLPGLNWPAETEEISPEIGSGVASGVTAAVTSLLRKSPDWDGVLNPKMSIIKSGLIDSIGLIELAQELQDKFSVHIFPEEVNETNFNTIGSICRLIQEKLTVNI